MFIRKCNKYDKKMNELLSQIGGELCINGCGREAAPKSQTCCNKCTGPSSKHSTMCEMKNAPVSTPAVSAVPTTPLPVPAIPAIPPIPLTILTEAETRPVVPAMAMAIPSRTPSLALSATPIPSVPQNISILSYNISWEMMTASLFGTFCNPGKITDCEPAKNRCFANVLSYIQSKNADIIALQEASCHRNITQNLPINYLSVRHRNDKEEMVTLYDANKFNILGVESGEFGRGRPYIILELREKTTGQMIIFGNVHCGHGSNEHVHSNATFKNALFQIINNYTNPNVIIAGDFNYNYTRDVDISDGQNRLLLYLDLSRDPTCCDQSGRGSTHHMGKLDYIIYNRNTIMTIVENKNTTSSDHLPIHGIITI
jgi:endonuclease/exonuclease/phosphatase family metal-dependent hydrolase